MTEMGSLPEWQGFSRSGAKLQDRFRDCTLAPLTAGDGWLGERRLLPQVRGDAVPLVTLCAHGGSKI